MSENKKGPGSSLANSQGTNKSSNKLYHERNEESKMNISTAVSVLKNNLERYDEQMKMHGIMGGDLLGENPTISAMRKAVEICGMNAEQAEELRERLITIRQRLE